MRGSDLRREFRRIKGEVVFGLVRGFDGVLRPVFSKRAAGGANIIRGYLVRSDKPGLRAKLCSLLDMVMRSCIDKFLMAVPAYWMA